MGLLARACSRGGVWLDGGRRVTATLMLAAGAQVLATPALAQQTCTHWQDGGILPGGGVAIVAGVGTCVRGTVVDNGGWQDVLNGGVASGTVVDGGEQEVNDGGVANDTTIDGGTQNVHTGGEANRTTINNGGEQYVYDNGAASGTVISDGGVQRIDNPSIFGGRATDTTIEGGVQSIGAGGQVFGETKGYGTIDLYGGSALVVDGGTSGLEKLTASGGTLTVKGDVSATVSSGMNASANATLDITGTLSGTSAMYIDGGTVQAHAVDAVKLTVNAASRSLGARDPAGTFVAETLKTTSGLYVSGGANAAVGALDNTRAQSVYASESGVLILGNGGSTTPPTRQEFENLRAQTNNSAAVALRGISADKATINAKTLVVEKGGNSVGAITGFENLYFILPADTVANETMLEITRGASTFAQMVNVGVAVAGGAQPLKLGDSVTLLSNSAGFTGIHGSSGIALDTDYQKFSLKGRQGISLEYDFALDNDANNIFAKVTTAPTPTPKPKPQPKPTPQPQPQPEPTPQPSPQPQPQPEPQPEPQPGPRVNPQTKAIPEGREAALGALNLGNDMVMRMTGNLPLGTGGGAPNFGGGNGAGSNGAGGGNGAGAPNTQTPGDTTVFAEITGHRQKIETGSHVNVNGAAAIVGAAKVVPLANGGTAAVGAFFEYGDGTFKTHNDFDTGTVNGKGDSSYYGAGVMAKATLAPRGNGAPFVEGSLHAGRIRNNWHTDDLRDAATGQRAQYNIRTPYMGAHVGAGYRWQTNDSTQVEVFGQYLYTHLDGKDTTVALDPYHFSAVKSSRTRVGAKGAWAVSPQTQAYAGAAWEHEFDGTARATAYSLEVPAPTMKGDTAVLDAGVTFQPRQNLSTNVGVTGYAGKRKGASANVEVQYRF